MDDMPRTTSSWYRAGARRPAWAPLVAALVPAACGCASSTTLGYAGTASAQASGAPAALAHAAVQLTFCKGHDEPDGLHHTSLALLTVGGCSLVGRMQGASFAPEEPAQSCVLDVPGGPPSPVRVSDVTASLRWRGGRYSQVDRTLLTVRLGGDQDGADGPRHVLYDFTGTIEGETDGAAACQRAWAERDARWREQERAKAGE